jgi:lysophospholipase L1-like esterase
VIRPKARLVVACLAVALLGGCTANAAPSPASPTSSGSETSGSAPVIDGVGTVLVLGDSISLGVNACPGDRRICASGSWVTGNDPTVGSLRSRVARQSPSTQVVNFARDGGRLGTALQYGGAIRDQDPGLVIILLGANDACAPSTGQMTSVELYRSELGQLLNGLRHGLPAAPVLVMSVPDINQVWKLGHADPDADRIWSSSATCASLLAHPSSESAEDAARRALVAQRVDGFNRAIQEECAAVTGCYTDQGALHHHRFDRSEISTIDYFHPSVAGQSVVADLVWKALKALPSGPVG